MVGWMAWGVGGCLGRACSVRRVLPGVPGNTNGGEAGVEKQGPQKDPYRCESGAGASGAYGNLFGGSLLASGGDRGDAGL